ncbi:HigA family addiction module antitoxin [Cysteiniphilum halobium]|uniref:HigA family addiction module antitoxin n=1 Tax=Cysteiniphilum halobium TaxID=2219059 RepID=UPI003F85F120
MFNPSHPGEILKHDILEALDEKITITEAAKRLGVTRSNLSNLLNCKMSVSIDMAIRLSQATDTTAEFWINLQTQYDLAQARSREKSLNITPFSSIHSQASLRSH